MKRFFDFCVAAISLALLFVPLVLIALVVRLKLGGPVFFSQLRPGLHGKPFRMFKFRSMTDECSDDGTLLPDARRLTRFGALLRATSIDELPALWNILRGEMSLVGPRPLLIEYMQYYTEEEKLRHTVRPGLTGLAQISGRNNLSWNERLRLDVEYVQNMSFFNDIQILLRTVKKVLRRDGVVIIPSTVFGKLSDERRIDRGS